MRHPVCCGLCSQAAGPSIPILRKDWNGVEGQEGDVFYFGIVDVLQPYTLKKQLEHSLKSLVQVSLESGLAVVCVRVPAYVRAAMHVRVDVGEGSHRPGPSACDVMLCHREI